MDSNMPHSVSDDYYTDMLNNPPSSGTMYPSLPIPDNNGYARWPGSESPYSSQSSAPASDFGPQVAWSYAPSNATSMASSYDDPSMFNTSTSSYEWPSYSTMPNTTQAWTPSVNPSLNPFATYGSNLSQDNSGWCSSSSQGVPSPFSEVPPTLNHRPSLTRSISADSGISSSAGFSAYFPTPSFVVSAPSTPEGDDEYMFEANDDTPVADSKPRKSKSKTPSSSSKSASKSASKKTDSKQKPTSSSSSSSSSNKRKTSTSSPAPAKSSSAALSKRSIEAQHQAQIAQLTKQFGSRMAPMPVGLDTHRTAEQVRREAWRVCKAEAIEQSQRRLALEKGRAVIERESRETQANLALIREATLKSYLELEETVARAEKLTRRSGY